MHFFTWCSPPYPKETLFTLKDPGPEITEAHIQYFKVQILTLTSA